MKTNIKNAGKKKTASADFSRIKNSDLVTSKQMLIAKKSAKLFIKKGYAKTTIREISKATGLAMGNLYDYIKKKEDILCLVFDIYHQTVEESSYGPQISAIEDPLEQLQANIRVSLENIYEFHDEVVLMYLESRHLPSKYLERAKKREMAQIAKMETILRQGMAKGVFYVEDPFFMASMLFYLMTGPALRGWTFRGKYSREKVDQMLENFIMKNILIPEQPVKTKAKKANA